MLVKQFFYLFFLIFSIVFIKSQSAEALCSTPFDDWIVAPACESLCEGYYCEAPSPFPTQPPDEIAQQPITATARSGTYPQNGPIQLQGQVHLIEGNSQLFTDKLTLYRDPKAGTLKTAVAHGNVKIIEPGYRVDAPLATLDNTQDLQTMHQACFRLYERHAHGTSDTVTIYGKTRMELKTATYTTCNPYQNTWHLGAKQVNLNRETGRGQAHHATLYLKDMPVFYFPYIDFPIDDRRATGFLFPNAGYTHDSGLELSTPFYWNLAPNYDALLTPTWYTKRGIEARGLFRYLSLNSRGELEGAILPHDRAYKAFQQKHLYYHPGIPNDDPRVTGLKGNATREALRFNHVTRFNPHWENRIAYYWVGDDNYFEDFGNTLSVASTTQQLQQADLLYQDCDWNSALRLQQYQTLHPFFGPVTMDVYKRLPQFLFTRLYTELPFGLEWAIEGDCTHFDHAHSNHFAIGNRFQTRPSLRLPLTQPGWFLIPRIQWDFLAEDLKVPAHLNHDARELCLTHLRTPACISARPTRSLPLFDVDSGLIFERDIQIGQCPYIQTLEPRLYYLYVPYRNQKHLAVFDTNFIPFDFNQLYRDNRFSGFDRIGDTNQVTLGLTQRFLTTQTGTERLNITLGQIYYFKDRKVFIHPAADLFRHQLHSAIVGRMMYRIHNHWSLYGEVEWDPDKKQADKRSINLQYSPDPLDVLNFRYLFIRDNLNIINPVTLRPERLDQTDISYAWRLTEQWRILGRWHYDIVRHRSNDILIGIEQQGCCTAFRFSVTRFLPPNDPLQRNLQPKTRFQLQIVFKGLAGVGTKIQPMLAEKIPGYRWRGDVF